ncbi:MAG: hypothetical protein GYB64_07220, partial [Chloroflexi bacterium]|nr:hypothetical protein [Chloroflexota bacterium]
MQRTLRTLLMLIIAMVAAIVMAACGTPATEEVGEGEEPTAEEEPMDDEDAM